LGCWYNPGKHVAGKPVTYDASSLAGVVVEVSGGGVECRLCGRVVGLTVFKHHLQSKYCDRLGNLVIMEAYHQPQPTATS
jgi:hypothetical protein